MAWRAPPGSRGRSVRAGWPGCGRVRVRVSVRVRVRLRLRLRLRVRVSFP